MLISIGGGRKKEDGLIDLLLACHERIRSFVGVAAEVGRRDDLDEAEAREALDGAARYFREAFPLHVADEEESVLPRLRDAGEDVARALEVMRLEHRAHEPLVRVLIAAIDDARATPSSTPARAALLAVAEQAERELGIHLAQEERGIFPVIAARITADEERAAIAEVRARRTSRAG